MNSQSVSKLVGLAAAIPQDTTDVRLLVKKEMWSRGISSKQLAKRLGLTGCWVRTRLCPGVKSSPGSLSPKFIDRLVKHLHIDPKIARRLHYLGAIDAGWNVEEIRPRPRVTQNEGPSAPVPMAHSQGPPHQLHRLTP